MARSLQTLTVAALLVLPASVAGAQQRPILVQGPPLRQACFGDYMRLCRGVPFGGGRVLTYLNAQADQLSQTCFQALTVRGLALPVRSKAAGLTTRGFVQTFLRDGAEGSRACRTTAPPLARPAGPHCSGTGSSMAARSHFHEGPSVGEMLNGFQAAPRCRKDVDQKETDIRFGPSALRPRRPLLDHCGLCTRRVLYLRCVPEADFWRC